MRNFRTVRWLKLWLIVTMGILLLCAAYFHFVIGKKALAPIVPVVSSCNSLGPGMRRIGDQYGFQFDVPIKDFAISEGTSDAIPVVHGFDLKLKNGVSVLGISFGSRATESIPVDPASVFSNHVEKRSIFDDKGEPIGEDDWGYLDSGERWRRIQLRGRGVAKYNFVNEKEAELFDRVISSVCLLPAPGS